MKICDFMGQDFGATYVAETRPELISRSLSREEQEDHGTTKRADQETETEA